MTGLIGETLDHYRVRAQIGQGGMATVYRAVDGRDLSEVAVKVLSPTIGGERRFLRRFRREAELVKQHLRHPNIVPVIDYGEYKGFVYLVMPFIAGDTLQDRLESGRISSQNSGKWMGQVADALAFAHNQGIIHRDIKPSNILINSDQDAMLTDFGLAREVEGTSSLTGSMLMGTPAYVSPEQGKGEVLDPRSDQYSFGVILYQVATGRLPFESEAPMATVLAHIQEPVPRPRRFNKELPESVEKVILKSLAKRREDRFNDVSRLDQAYQAALAGEALPLFDLPPELRARGITARDAAMPPPSATPAPMRRRRWPWVAVTLATITLLAVGSLWAVFGGGLATPEFIETAASPPVAALTSPPAEPTAPPATDTPVPTQAPPVTSQDCPGIAIYAPVVEGGDVTWMLLNDTGAEVTLLAIPDLSWGFTGMSGGLERILLGDRVLAEGEDLQGELNSEFPIGTLAPGRTTPFTFEYPGPAGRTGYAFTLEFDVGCALSGTW